MRAYDAAVVGGSIAGLYAGMKIARGGMNVCIIDRKHRIGTPVRCGEATGNYRQLSRFFDIHKSCIAREIAGLTLHINSHTISRNIPEAGVVLNRDILEQQLAEQARSFGATILLDTSVTGLHDNHRGDWDGVTVENGRLIEARYIIGADGCESWIGQWAGITSPLALNEVVSTIEYHMESRYCDDGNLHFFTGTSVIPAGYIWVFPKGDNHMLVGGGIYGCPRNVPKVKYYVDAFIQSRIPGAKPYSMITGCVPVTVCPRDLTCENVLVVGDAARQVNPLTAGGIMNALEAADLAADAILTCGDDDGKLRIYSRKWARNQRRQQKLYRLLRDIIVNSSDNEMISLAETARRVFKEGFDGSKPYQLPAVPLAVLALSIFPKVIRYRSALAG